MREMPLYTCHKEVRALKIATVTPLAPSHVNITFEDETFHPLTVDVSKKPTPEAGWYYVVYANGYDSFSPPAEFEDGYSLKDDGVHDPADGEQSQPNEKVNDAPSGE